VLRLIVIFLVGGYFNRLATKFERNKTVYTILGIAVFLIARKLSEEILWMGFRTEGLPFDFIYNGFLSINTLSIGLGLLVTWGLYALLKNSWSDHSTRKRNYFKRKDRSLSYNKTGKNREQRNKEGYLK
jgi:hypothetical protein